MFDPEWTKSSYSSQDGGDCVEWEPPPGPTSPSARPHGRSL
ncbi:DUF397 domain-containing protein [Streptomyces albidoflavus]